jgi:hypothetical protein
MATALQIVQDAYNEIGIQPPTSILDDGRSLAIINRELASLRDFNNWEKLLKTATITTIASTSLYDFPADFNWHYEYTFWNGSQKWRLRGPLNPKEWAQVTTQDVSTGVDYYFRIRNNQLELYPTPDSVQTITVEYSSINTVLANDAITEKEAITADDDTMLLDDEVIALGVKWRLARSFGLGELEDYRREYRSTRDNLLRREKGGRQLTFNTVSERFPVNTPEGNWS